MEDDKIYPCPVCGGIGSVPTRYGNLRYMDTTCLGDEMPSLAAVGVDRISEICSRCRGTGRYIPYAKLTELNAILGDVE